MVPFCRCRIHPQGAFANPNQLAASGTSYFIECVAPLTESFALVTTPPVRLPVQVLFKQLMIQIIIQILVPFVQRLAFIQSSRLVGVFERYDRSDLAPRDTRYPSSPTAPSHRGRPQKPFWGKRNFGWNQWRCSLASAGSYAKNLGGSCCRKTATCR